MTERSGELGETEHHSAKRKKNPKTLSWHLAACVFFLCLLMPTVLPGNHVKVELCKQKQKKRKKEKLEAPLAWSWQTCTGKTKQSDYLSWWLIKTDDSYVIQPFSRETGSSLTVFMHLVTVSGARVSLSGLLLKGCNVVFWVFFPNLVLHSKSKNESESLLFG